MKMLFQNMLDNSVASTSPREHSILDNISVGLPKIQQSIMSMEDDDMSDQEVVSLIIQILL